MSKPKRIDFWQSVWGDVGRYERHAINQAADCIESLGHTNVVQSEQLARLFALDRAQSAEIERLRLTIKVLIELLVEAGGVDERVLHYRIEAALEEQTTAWREAEEAHKRQFAWPPSQVDASASPAAVSPSAPAAVEQHVRCTSCTESVPASQSHILETGLVCDRCYTRLQTR